MKRHCMMLIAAAALATACGESRNIAGPSATSVDSFGAASSDATTLATRFTRGPNSCPDGDYPRHLWAHENGRGGVRLMWEEVLSISTYIVESERMNVLNVYERELSTSTSERFIDAAVGGGRHRFRVRTKNLCDQLGPWSEYEYYSSDFDNTPSAGINTPSPSLPHGNDGSYGDEGSGDSGQNNEHLADNIATTGDTNPGGSENNAGNLGGGNPGGGESNAGNLGGGNGGSNPCKVDGPGGKNDHNGNDHNNDGHNDCGQGQGKH